MNGRNSLGTSSLAARETLSIVARRYLQHAHKSRPHLVLAAVAALLGNGFDALIGFFKASAGRIKPDRIHCFRGRATALGRAKLRGLICTRSASASILKSAFRFSAIQRSRSAKESEADSACAWRLARRQRVHICLAQPSRRFAVRDGHRRSVFLNRNRNNRCGSS